MFWWRLRWRGDGGAEKGWGEGGADNCLGEAGADICRVGRVKQCWGAAITDVPATGPLPTATPAPSPARDPISSRRHGTGGLGGECFCTLCENTTPADDPPPGAACS